MLDRYGQDAPLCEDKDGDRYSPVYGDCDDTDSSRYPGAREQTNKVDDNCNGSVDEKLFKEPRGGFPKPKAVTLPAQMIGRVADPELDTFVAKNAQPGPISVELCADLDLKGGVRVYRNGAYLGYHGVDGNCFRKSYEFDLAGELKLEVVGTGKYALLVEQVDPWPIPWGRIEPPRLRLRGTVDLTSVTESLRYVSATPDTIRFWVSGYGFVGSVPYAAAATLKWRPKPALQHGSYGVRAQLVKGDTPVSDVTPATLWLAAAEPEPVVIEAESMILDGYVVETNIHASGKRLISRRRAPGKPPGKATAEFPGPAGSYDVMVSYFDENDGRAELAFSFGARTLDKWMADEDPDCQVCRRPNASTRRTRMVARGLTLAPGDVLGLQGTEQRGDYARIDRVVLSPVRAHVVEAETMNLDGFVVEDNTHASGGRLISRRRAPGGPPGRAATKFSGPAGSYDVTVAYFDENDGQGKLAFSLNGQRIDQWVADEDPVCRSCGRPSAETLRTRVVANNLALIPGDELGLEGSENRGDYARLDRLGFGPIQISTLEAEAMDLQGYLVENNRHASGGKLISRRFATSKPPGRASTRFSGPAGIYDVAVSYFDEKDGQALLALARSGQRLDQWVADEDPGCGACGRPNAKTLRTRIVARGLSLYPGDKIELLGTQRRGDYARIDKVTLMRWGTP
jgi:hypothetical protein